MNGRIGDFEKIGMFLVWEIGADELKRPHREPEHDGRDAGGAAASGRVGWVIRLAEETASPKQLP
jgi:hypothetical protein